MLTATQNTKIDPIFAAIEAHRQATGERYIILEALCEMRDDAPEHSITEGAHDKALKIEIAATCETQENPADDHCRRDGGGGVLRGTFGPLPWLRLDKRRDRGR